MKRFYCTVCKRTIRVRKYPPSVSNISSDVPSARQGHCKWHDLNMQSGQKTRAQFMQDVVVKGGR